MKHLILATLMTGFIVGNINSAQAMGMGHGFITRMRICQAATNALQAAEAALKACEDKYYPGSNGNNMGPSHRRDRDYACRDAYHAYLLAQGTYNEACGRTNPTLKNDSVNEVTDLQILIPLE